MTKDTVKMDIERLIDEALEKRDERARYILAHRYGLDGNRKKTLAELGEKYTLTRERIRQIEAASLKEIRDEIKEHEDAIAFLKLLEGYFKDVGNVSRGDFVARDVASLLKREEENEKDFYNKLHFIASALKWPEIDESNNVWHVIWYTDPKAHRRAHDLVEELLNTDEHDFDAFLEKASKKFKLTEPLVINHLAISKKFKVGPYGDLGADHWVHVNPRTVRDKAYLVLQRSDDALHFSEIARLINELDDKTRAPATVHNELIRDPRFTLVRRGTYTLDD